MYMPSLVNSICSIQSIHVDWCSSYIRYLLPYIGSTLYIFRLSWLRSIHDTMKRSPSPFQNGMPKYWSMLLSKSAHTISLPRTLTKPIFTSGLGSPALG